MADKARKSFPSELRLDLISNDWVVIATGRAKRPENFKQEKTSVEKTDPADCPFCNINGQENPTLIYADGKKADLTKRFSGKWTTISFPNKYPAFIPNSQLETHKEGDFYQKMNAVGYHEVIVTSDHDKSIGQMDIRSVKEVMDVYQERYLSLMDETFVNYISIFHNHGKAAGASIAHPHSQLITTPLIDVDLKGALLNAEKYFKSKKKCAYCEMNVWEMKVKERIVFENSDFLVVCPFASKAAFEMIITPKCHLSNFEEITETQKEGLAEAFQAALGKLYRGLGNPAYNFYLHTAPADSKRHLHYHWHWTILPKTATWAGFEIGTRMEISTIEPEKAAEYLKQQ